MDPGPPSAVRHCGSRAVGQSLLETLRVASSGDSNDYKTTQSAHIRSRRSGGTGAAGAFHAAAAVRRRPFRFIRPGGRSCRDAVRATFAELFENFPDFSFETYRVFHGAGHWVLDWALISGEIRFDCVDVVDVSADGLVARKDTFVDMVRLRASTPVSE